MAISRSLGFDVNAQEREREKEEKSGPKTWLNKVKYESHGLESRARVKEIDTDKPSNLIVEIKTLSTL